MEIEDFLPKYPFVQETILDPYTPSRKIGDVIYHKKEFYENRLPSFEIFPKDKGILTRSQKTIARLMSSHTPIESLLLVHSMGTGKTCSAIGAIEQVRKENTSIYGALILAKGKPILDNFLNELAYKCTAGEYLPPNISSLTNREIDIRIKKKADFYSFNTFAKFAKKLKTMTDKQVETEFSNLFIVLDEVHNLRDQEDEEMKDAYPQFHRLLHLIKNCKVLLLSGTPMKDTPEEIASILNLLLPVDEQLPVGKQFIDEYLFKKDERTFVKQEKIQDLKDKMKGRVSFLREAQSSVPRQYLGTKNVGSLVHLVVNPLIMSEFQTQYYTDAYKKDRSEEKAFYTNSKEASLFVYPDGSYGRAGFEKYISLSETKTLVQRSEKNYKLNKELTLAVQGNTFPETINKIKKYSVSYADTLERITNTKGCCFIYSNSVTGSGAILFSLLLEKIGFKKASGNEVGKAPRYIILTNQTATTAENKQLVNAFNNPRNVNGEYIKIIIGSRAISEGFSFQNILFETILTPHWNYSETSQAIARGIRFGSHDLLVKQGIRPLVNIVQQVSLPSTKDVPSIDLIRYELSEDKDINIRYMMRLLMESAIDCALNYNRNHISGFDYQRECDYLDCDYKCDDVTIDNLSMDYSTYQLYYIKPIGMDLRHRIEDLFRTNSILDIPSIISALKDKYNEDEILNALYRISQEETSFSYKTFLKYYGETSTQQVTIHLEKLFTKYFSIDLETLMKNMKGLYTQMEVVVALDTLINENRRVKNMYGFDCYIREYNNVYFLVNGISDEPNLFSSYYTKYPSIKEVRTFEEVTSSLYTESLPRVIEKLFEAKDEGEMKKLLATIPEEVQSLLLETCIYAETKKLEKGKRIRTMLLEYYKSYIKKLRNTYISTFKGTRCFEEDGKWGECSQEIKEDLDRQGKERSDQIRQNPYKFFGKENPENKKFCIIDLEQERKGLEQKEYDTRLKYTGKVCSDGGFSITTLMNMIIKRARIPAPLTFLTGKPVSILRQKLLEDIQSDTTSKLKELYTSQDIPSMSETELRSALYWGTKKDGGVRGLVTLCKALRDWMYREGILEIDNQCGIQGKKKEPEKEKEKKEKKVKKYVFRNEIISSQDPRLKPFLKNINKLMEICFDSPYKVDINSNNRWILVISGKRTLAGILMMDPNNFIWNVCVAPKFRKQGVAKQAIQEALGNMCMLAGNPPTLLVDNKGVNKDRLISMYESFGFEIVKSDDKYTSMRHPCKT